MQRIQQTKELTSTVPLAGTVFFAYFQIDYFTCRSKRDILRLLRQME
ncbi:hypothetical protein [Paenibacillus tundrae]|nr:hypothetical protein [Paenibacillus tundrae]